MNDEYTVFVCQQHRPATDREGCCLARGGAELLAAFRAAVDEAGLADRVDVRPSTCLDHCPQGPVALVLPGRGKAKPPTGLTRLFTRGVTYYGKLVPRDATGIVREHLTEGTVVARCRV